MIGAVIWFYSLGCLVDLFRNFSDVFHSTHQLDRVVRALARRETEFNTRSHYSKDGEKIFMVTKLSVNIAFNAKMRRYLN